MKFDVEYMERSMRPSRWDRPADKMKIEDMICTPEQAKMKREFANKFMQYDFEWSKLPNEKERED